MICSPCATSSAYQVGHSRYRALVRLRSSPAVHITHHTFSQRLWLIPAADTHCQLSCSMPNAHVGDCCLLVRAARSTARVLEVHCRLVEWTPVCKSHISWTQQDSQYDAKSCGPQPTSHWSGGSRQHYWQLTLCNPGQSGSQCLPSCCKPCRDCHLWSHQVPVQHPDNSAV